MYLSMYHLPHVCEILHVFQYIDMLTCMIYNCTQLNSKDDWSRLEILMSAVKIKQRLVNA